MNRKKADVEARKLMQEKGDMFERYLRKPRNSSIGFLALNSAQKRERNEMMRQHSITSNRVKKNQSNYSISQVTSLRTKKEYSVDDTKMRSKVD